MNKGLLTFRDLVRAASVLKPRKLSKYKYRVNQAEDTHKLGKSSGVKINKTDKNVLIRFIDNLSKIPSNQIQAVYHLIICFEITASKPLLSTRIC